MDTPSCSRALPNIPPAPTTGRSTRSRLATDIDTAELEEAVAAPGSLDDEVAEDDAEGDDGGGLSPEPGLSRPVTRGRGRGRSRGRGRGRGRGGRAVRERTGAGTADENDEEGKSLRIRKSVSYREIPVEAVEDEEEVVGETDLDAEGEVDAEGEAEEAIGTPRPRLRTSEQPTASPSRREIQKIGSGRGGFSVKGAAAAAARARWAKYRNGRGDDSDDGERSRKARNAAGIAAARKDSKAAAERVAEGTTLEIKGKEYLVGDDELLLDADEKGDLKVDADGKLLGGREYRLVTFTSKTRKNPNRIYALSVDAARACGYTDSLAFLRRCPQVLKLVCNAEERQMLIDIGRVTGNLKNRMVTMVSMRNVYKLMGARVVKNGKWVADDYYEDKAQVECVENGFIPFAPIHEDEILANALAHMAPQGRQSGFGGGSGANVDSNVPRSLMSLAPTYAIGGPTTHFADNGADPWSEAGWGNKRTKLKNLGVSEEDWMFRTAVDCRGVDEMLREMREERLGSLEGRDLEGWVWRLQRVSQGEGEEEGGSKEEEIVGGVKREREVTAEWLRPPVPERRRSGLSQEVIPEDVQEEGEQPSQAVQAGQAGEAGDTEMNDPEEEGKVDDGVERTEGGKIVVQTQEDGVIYRAKYGWGTRSWEPGVVRAIIEPHTHIPHIPLHTQPQSSTTSRLSHNPLLTSLPDSSYKNHAQAIISGTAARGLASVEFAFDSNTGGMYRGRNREQKGVEGGDEYEMRMKLVKEAEEWEREAKERKVLNEGVVLF